MGLHYVKYDEKRVQKRTEIQKQFSVLEKAIKKLKAQPRSKICALNHLEESMMWVGKALRDEQEWESRKAEVKSE